MLKVKKFLLTLIIIVSQSLSAEDSLHGNNNKVMTKEDLHQGASFWSGTSGILVGVGVYKLLSAEKKYSLEDEIIGAMTIGLAVDTMVYFLAYCYYVNSHFENGQELCQVCERTGCCNESIRATQRSCGHIFRIDCLENAKNKQCPLCSASPGVDRLHDQYYEENQNSLLK